MANNQMELNFPKGGVFLVIVAVAAIILFSKSTVTIGPGEGGVIFETLGDGINTEKSYGEGFHIVAPWNRMIVRKVRQQSISDEMNVLSVNGLEVKVNGTIWYEPEFENLGKLIKTKGEDYERELLDPAINAAARSVVGRYTPEQLYSSKRDVIEQEILDEVQKVLKGQKLADADGPFSVALHAPTSGEVLAIDEQFIAHPSGQTDCCITLIPDGEDKSNIEAKLIQTEKESAIAEAATAKELGYELCKCTFPPQIMLFIKELNVSRCPKCHHTTSKKENVSYG